MSLAQPAATVQVLGTDKTEVHETLALVPDSTGLGIRTPEAGTFVFSFQLRDIVGVCLLP